MISNYNTAVIPAMIDYIKQLIQRVEESADPEKIGETKINLEKYSKIDTNNLNISYLTTHGLTGYFTLKLYFKIIIDGNITNFDTDLNIPKMINNSFVIDGSLRVPTNTLDNDNEINVYTDNIRINDILSITYTEDPTCKGGYKLVAYSYIDDEPDIFELTDESINQKKDLFQLTHVQKNKIKIKLDTDEVGDYLTVDMILGLINLGLDRIHDNMIDKKIYSCESNLMKYMWSRDIRRKILNDMKSRFFQHGKIFIRGIQNAIDRYYKIASEKNIDFPNSTNPIGYDSLRYKIVIPETVMYNHTMSDVIDVANTPINGNVNKLNELNVCVDVRDNIIYMKCYEYPSQNPVEVEYSDYCVSKVIQNIYWDYDNKKFKDSESQINYNLRLKSRIGTTTDEYDYIEPKPDDKLSMTTRRIPFGNMSDSVRVSMGTSMLKQSVELSNSEPSLITPGYDDIDAEKAVWVTRFKGNGTITKIEDNKIYIKMDDGSIQFYDIQDPVVGSNDTIISFEVNVKVGDKLKDDDILIEPRILRRKSYELGTNANVVYMNYLGYSYEDGQIISESMAKKLQHYSILNVQLPLYSDDIIRYIKKIGSKVRYRDILVNNQTKLKASESTNKAYDSGIVSGLGIQFNQNNLLCPNNVELGYILDVNIHLEEGRGLTSEFSRKTIEEYLRDNKTDEYNEIPKKYKSLHADEMYMDDRMVGYISIKIIRVDIAKIGDKITNRYGGKGIISLVMPDNCMPRIEHSDGTKIQADLILNAAGVLHRKNISQIYECEVSKCIQVIYTKVTEFIKSNNIKGAKEFLKTYYKNQFDSLTDREFIDNHNKNGIFAYQMKVGFFSKLGRQEILDWMKQLGVSETDTIYCPSIVTVETVDGLKVYPLDSYVPKEGDKMATRHELGYCENECVTGNEYILKLFHSASYSGKATPYIFDLPDPVMGKGIYREAGGQRLGEMENWILMETGAEKFLTSQSPDMTSNQYVFLNELLMSGYFIEDKNGNPLLSNNKSNQQALVNLVKDKSKE